MSKCIRCGGSFVTRRKIQLKDAEICGKCFKELGFDKSDLLTASIYPYAEIKDGKQSYYLNKRKKAAKDEIIGSVSVSMSSYGEERDLICTEEEREIFEELEIICADVNPPHPLQLVRVSDNYVSAKIGDWDLARFKYTNRAKWLSLPIVEASSQKHQIEAPGDVADYSDQIRESVEHIKKYE